eukprot:131109-Amphidinium_carterae.1
MDSQGNHHSGSAGSGRKTTNRQVPNPKNVRLERSKHVKKEEFWILAYYRASVPGDFVIYEVHMNNALLWRVE